MEPVCCVFLVPHPQAQNMQQIVVALCNADQRLNQLRQEHDHKIQQFHFDDHLSGFQMLLKSLLECVSSVYTRARIYQNLVNRCQTLDIAVTRDSVVDYLTAGDKHSFGARLGKGKTVIDFATKFEEAILNMEDDEFMQRMSTVDGMGFYIAFQLNVFGRRRLDYFPARENKFRRALKWFAVNYDNYDVDLAIPTPGQATQMAQLWEPRRGVAAYLILAASPRK